MSTVRALFFKSSCSINAVFLWDLPCQRRNHQGVRSMVALFTKSLFSVMHKWLSTFGATARQEVKTGQSQVRVIGSLSCTCQMFYMQKKHKNLTCFKKKKAHKHKCTRADLPTIILFQGFDYMLLYTTKLHTHTSRSIVLSVPSRMHSCALLVFFPM